MRKKNAYSEFESQRSKLLLENFRRAIAAQSQISLKRAFQSAAETPAPRFWVSEARAANVIGAMLRGINLTEGMYEEKREMYEEIYRRVLKIREKEPEACVADMVFRVVNEEAPRSYVSWIRVRDIIYREKRNRRNTNC